MGAGEAEGGKRRALGRGLSALLPATPAGGPPPPPPPRAASATGPLPTAVTAAPPPRVVEEPPQKKTYFTVGVEELAASIRAHGVIQPLIVRTRPEGGFSLIAGERRWRASQRAGLLELPVVVQDVSSGEAFERALIENIQRADLNAMEEAEAYARLVSDFSLTQEQVAERVGKERSTVANSLRLLKLPPSVRGLVEENQISMGHARALLALESTGDMETVARQVVARGLSVRATEAAVRQKVSGRSEPEKAPAAVKSASVRDVENRLTRSLGAQVELTEDRSGKGGTVEIRYADLDDLDRLLERMLRP
jgi:ParB family chromosome partitioning protein